MFDVRGLDREIRLKSLANFDFARTFLRGLPALESEGAPGLPG
jgi:hypothetical protein